MEDKNKERCKHNMVREWCAFCLGARPSDYNPAAKGAHVIEIIPIDRQAARTCEGGDLWWD